MPLFQKKYWERKELDKRRSPSHLVIKEYVLPKIEEIKKFIPIDKETKLLDVGCGNGFFSYYFNKICDTTGIDYSEKMLKSNPLKKKYLMDANHIKFKDNTFDIVFSHALLHHISNPEKVIKEMKRVSKKYIILLEPNRNNPLMFLFSLIVKEERAALKFTTHFLERLIKKSDLKFLSSFSHGLIVPNKTPPSLLPFLRLFNFRQPLGMTLFIIAKK